MNRRRLAVGVAATVALAPSQLVAQTEDALCTYKASLLTMNSMLTWFFDEVSRLSLNASETAFVDPQWQVDVLAPFAVAQAAQRVIADMAPPSDFTATHDLMTQAVDELVLGQTAMELGILGPDLAAI